MRDSMKLIIGLFTVLVVASSYFIVNVSDDSNAETGDGSVFAAEVGAICDSVFGEGTVDITVESSNVNILVDPSDITAVSSDSSIKELVEALLEQYEYVSVNGNMLINNYKKDMAVAIPITLNSLEALKAYPLEMGDNAVLSYAIHTVKADSSEEEFTLNFILEFTDSTLLAGVQALQANLTISSDPFVIGLDLSDSNLNEIVPIEDLDNLTLLDYAKVLFSSYSGVDVGNMQPVLDYMVGIMENSHIDPTEAVESAIKKLAHKVSITLENDGVVYYFGVNDDGSFVTDVPEGTVYGWDAPVSKFTDGGQFVGSIITLKAGETTYTGIADVVIPTHSEITIEDVSVSESSLDVGDVAEIDVTVNNPDNIPYSLTFVSSDESVVTVGYLTGIITAVGGGDAIVTVSIPGNSSKNLDVTVIVHVTEVQLNVDYVYMDVGDTYNLIVTVLPDNATDKSVKWMSSDENVVTVDEYGKITAVGGGDAKVGVYSIDGFWYAICDVHVVAHVEDITLNYTEVELQIGETVTLVPTIIPDNADEKGVIWESDDESVATVDVTGVVTAVGIGVTDIWVTSVDGGCIAYCTITVTALYSYEVRYLDENGNSLAEPFVGHAAYGTEVTGEIIEIEHYQAPSETKSIIISDDESQNVIEYTYTYVELHVTGVELNKDTLKLDVGKKATLVATVLPANADNKNVIWSSSDESVATVDQFGTVVAVSIGSVTITVTTEDGGFTARCEVTVPIHVTGVSLDVTSASLAINDTLTLIATVSPEYATDKSVSWSSSNKDVATVDENGNVVALKAGKATISVVTNDKAYRATCKITVVADQTYTVNYVDTNGDKVAETFTATASYGTTVTGPVKEIKGYLTPEEISITISNVSSKNVINYVYIAIDYGYSVNYVDVEGTELAEPVYGTASYGAIVVGPVKEIVGYVTPTMQSIIISDESAENVITYVYVIKEFGYVVNYIDYTGKTVAESIVGTAPYGSTVTAPVYEIEGYDTPAEQSIVITDNVLENVITYVYNEKTYEYTVNYVNANGEAIAEPFVARAVFGTIVSAPIAEIEGYTAPAKSIEIVISSDESENVAEYVYTLNKYGYTVNYYDEEGNKIAKSVTGFEYFGTTVTGMVRVIAGYIAPEAKTLVITADESANIIDYTYVAEVTPVHVTGVTLDQTTISLEIGKTAKLVATIAPADATNKNVVWSTSSSSVVTVTDGVITAIAKGTATVTVTTEDGGYTATCVVTVNPSVVPVHGVYLNKTTAIVKVGDSLTLVATVLPTNATNKNVVWSTSDESVATVVDGVVKAVAVGTVSIVVTTEDGGYASACTLTVTDESPAEKEEPLWELVVVFGVVCAGIIAYLAVLAIRARR